MVEALEARTLMATGPIRIATLGDSLTDEYEFYAPDRTAARNWVQQLSALRSEQVDFGEFSLTTRGETRNQGYAQNWARSNAVASTPTMPANPYDPAFTFQNELTGGFPDAGQLGLLNQPGGLTNVDAVVILIGGNDFKNEILVTLGDPTPGNFLSNLLAARTRVVQGVTSAVQQIRAADPTIPLVIVSTPDPGKTALLRNLFFSALPANEAQLALDVIGNIVNATDGDLQTIATTAGAGFLDSNDLLNNFLANPTIEGMYIDPFTGGPEYTNFFVGDDFHPGTIGQGLLANGIAGQLNTFFADRPITALTNTEILATAGAAQPVTMASLSVSAGEALPGDSLTLTVQVSTFPSFTSTSGDGTFPAPTGVVQFFDTANANRSLGLATLRPGATNGVATLSTSALGVGIHRIGASYSGDGVYPSTVMPAQLVLVGSRRQVRLFQMIVAYENRIAEQIAPPRLDRWTRLLDRGYAPRTVFRAILHQAAHPRRVATVV